MKKVLFLLGFTAASYFLSVDSAAAQCSICTKTAQQLGEKPAKGMNSGIIYLMLTPLAIMGYLGYRWYQNQQIEE
jgi:hypothetical protein